MPMSFSFLFLLVPQPTLQAASPSPIFTYNPPADCHELSENPKWSPNHIASGSEVEEGGTNSNKNYSRK